MSKYIYPTDLTDKEWEIVSPYLPVTSSTGRPRKFSFHDILNAIFYLVRTGCQWRILPKDYPTWPSVYYYWRKWRLNGSW